MEVDNSERVVPIVLPVAKRVSLAFVAWVLSIVGCIYATETVRLILVSVYYLLSVSLYFFAVQLDEAMENAGQTVKWKIKGTFWFVANLITALSIHYLLFWGTKAI